MYVINRAAQAGKIHKVEHNVKVLIEPLGQPLIEMHVSVITRVNLIRTI